MQRRIHTGHTPSQTEHRATKVPLLATANLFDCVDIQNQPWPADATEEARRLWHVDGDTQRVEFTRRTNRVPPHLKNNLRAAS